MKLIFLATFLLVGAFAEPESDAKPHADSKADADALAWYASYGYWPVGYTGYYYTHPYVLYGRKKREADAEPHADSKADADALAWYGIHGYWPVGYTGYYYTHGYPLAYSLYGRKKRAAEAEPRPSAEPHADSEADTTASH